MTPTLIDQLKLAIQVEEGSVSMSEIQYRVRPELKNVYNTGSNWSDIPLIHIPKYWNHEQYEYRRNTKPFEKWWDSLTWTSTIHTDTRCITGHTGVSRRDAEIIFNAGMNARGDK